MDFLNNPEKPQDRIFSILFKEDDLTWQNIIYDLVRNEGMDPWDIDVSEIAQKFLEMLKKLRDMDFRISGKIVFAAALLLKIKSNKLVDEDINDLDRLMNSVDDPESLLDELPVDGEEHVKGKNPRLMPKTPQPRKRKVSVDDLIQALEKALEVEVRRPPVYVPAKVQMRIPAKAADVGELINDVYVKVQDYYTAEHPQSLTFSQLIPSNSKDDKVFTFIPLLHLENQRKVDMSQKMHFGEIDIALAKPQAIITVPEPVLVPAVESPPEAPKRKKAKRQALESAKEDNSSAQ
jgi:segregation and condensation protein A